jgi:thiol-disulfide isomerase/thioredoxin
MTTAVPPTGMTFVKGNEIDFSKAFAAGNHVYVLEFWATWCPPCRTSIPHLTELAHKYAGQATFVGITSEPATKVKPFVNQMGPKMDYTVCIDEEDSASDNYMRKFNMSGIPSAFIVNKEGKVSWHGHPMEPEFEKQLAAAVAAKGKSTVKLTENDIQEMGVKDLKAFLTEKNISFQGVLEKSELVALALKAL